MFTTLAFGAVAVLTWIVTRTENKEQQRASLFDDGQVRQSIMFTREDVRLIAYLLAAILVALGILADRISN